MRKLLTIFFILLVCQLNVKAQCNAAFTASVNQATASFQATSNPAGAIHQWQFGDNQTGWGANVSHTYGASGGYTVWHILTDSINSCRDTFSLQIVISIPDSNHCNWQASFTSTVSPNNPRTLTFNPSPSFPGLQYAWTIMDNGVYIYNAQNPTHTFSQAGTYNVWLSITDTLFNCSDSIMQQVQIIDSNHCNWSASFTSTASPNNPRTHTFYPSPSQPGMQYAWTILDNGVYTYNVKNPVHTFSQAGTYNVWLSITDTIFNCSDSIMQQVQIIDSNHCNWSASFTTTTSPNNPRTRIFHPSPSFAGLQYSWSIMDNGYHTYNVKNPVHTFSQAGTYNVWLSITDTVHNCSDSIMQQVQIIDSNHCNWSASFTTTTSPNNPRTRIFHPSPSFAGLQYSWSIMDNGYHTYNVKNPVHTFSQAGTYNVWLSITDTVHNCSDSVMQQVQIIDSSCNWVASFRSVAAPSPNTKTHTFFPSPSFAGLQYNWTIIDNGTHTYNVKYPYHTFSQAGTYNVWLSITDTVHNCSDSVMQQVVVVDSSICNWSASFTSTTSPNNPRTRTFHPSPSFAGLQYAWTILDNGAHTYNVKNPVHTFSQAGTFMVWLSVTDTVHNCSDSVMRLIQIIDSAACNLTASFTTIAAPNHPRSVAFYPSPSAPGMQYRWRIVDNGLHIYTTKYPTHTFSAPGVYLVRLTVRDSITNCTDSITRPLTVYGTPADSCTINFTYNHVPGHPNQLSFTASSNQTITNWLWTITAPDTLNNATYIIANPVHTFSDTGYHYVCLRIRTNTGCIRNICRWIRIDSLGPNGRSGLITSYPNPVNGGDVYLQVPMQEAATIQLIVYNTSGNIVYNAVRSGGAGNNRVSIPVSSLQRGQYFVEIRYKNEIRKSIFQKL